MSKEKQSEKTSAIEEETPSEIKDGDFDSEAVLARRMFIRAGLVAAPLALAAFLVDRPVQAATCSPHWCSPGDPCNPVLCGPQICTPFD